MMETIHSSETSVLIRATRRHIPEDGILRSHRRENIKSYESRIALQLKCRYIEACQAVALYVHIFSAVGQAISRQLRTVAVRVRAPVRHVGFVVDIVALVLILSEYLCLPCHTFYRLPRAHCHYHPGWYNGPYSGRRVK
jgi:hypothetical protein